MYHEKMNRPWEDWFSKSGTGMGAVKSSLDINGLPLKRCACVKPVDARGVLLLPPSSSPLL